jgi:eukaryotic-like serine/threonine-protein kinase
MSTASVSVPTSKSAAELLLGRTVENGWRVVEEYAKAPGATGGNFSFCYIVEHPDGRRAFLKALDFAAAGMSTDPARTLQALTQAFNFERDLLERCRERRMDRVVRVIEDGRVQVAEATGFNFTQYLIFELSEGDIRKYLATAGPFNVAWTLRMLHHVATGLDQLHRARIAHQDLKPSNVLLFDAGTDSKLADVGRASCKDLPAPHDGFKIAGDPSYAPPEQLYNDTPLDWNGRRTACDAYHLGSLAMFAFTGVGCSAAWGQRLRAEHHWTRWGGAYIDVLPYVRAAFEDAIQEFHSSLGASPFAESLTRIVRQLCEPDPALRGHPRTRAQRHGDPYRLERYINELNVLARSAAAGIFR